MPQRKKQKAGRNGFYYFMLEVQKREAQKGNQHTLPHISEIANPLWLAMSPEQRKPYNDIAQTTANKNSEDMTKKFTSLGISYADLDAEQRELEEARNIMLATIRNTIANLDSKSTLKSHIFFVCHANYFYKTDHLVYFPAEIAFAAFSLEKGILQTKHFFVDPGKIPLGYKFEAADLSAKTHGIPVNDSTWNEGVKKPFEMYKKVKDFIKKFTDGTEVPPIYTMFDTLNANSRISVVRSALNMMCEAANEDSSLFRVYCLSHLFFEIRNKCSPDIPSVAIVKSELDKDVFSYARDLGCYYHEEKDLSVYCSLSVVTRWVYTICDHCCKHLGIQLVLGRHVPKDTDISASEKFIEDNYLSQNNTVINDPLDTSLTIIDYGSLKEQRAEQRRAQDVQLKEREKIRLPRSRYSNIGAQFSKDSCASSSQSSIETNKHLEEDGWLTVKGKPSGRGRALFRDSSPEQPLWPVSGRGRAFSNVNL